ncbi:PspC domain-containing protein [Compostibacter hankyongensis]|uniref:PspC domain-containing protein n=1 Tax=Compostibacter hankyongensis TaxID=1007089 RepID=A0ABP8FC38_9BACT
MKKIININLSSRLIPIEDTAYELLKNYLESLKRHFSREEGGEEIISDIESRIAEIFQEKLKKGAHCITDEDVSAMVATMGRPEQLEEETATEPQEKQHGPDEQAFVTGRRLMRNENDKVLGGVCSGIAAFYRIDPVIVRVITILLSLAWGTGVLVYILLWILLPSTRTQVNPVRRRLYRNPDHRVLGGVCSGLAGYFNLDAVVVRLIFVAPLFGVILFSILRHGPFWGIFPFFFSLFVGLLPTAVVVYLVLWIAVPKAVTITEKLEMRGEKVDLQAISNARKGDTTEKKSEVGAGEADVEADAAVTSGPAASSYYYPPRQRNGLGEIVLFCLKAIGFLLLGFVLLVLCAVLIGLAGGFMGASIFSGGIFPFRGILLHSFLQQFLAWPAILLTLGIPVVAIIWLLIRLITGFRPKSNIVGWTLTLLWVAGLICAIWLCISVARDFQMSFRENTPVPVTQPSGNRFVIRQAETNSFIGGGSIFGDRIRIADDTVFFNSVRLKVEKSSTDSFMVELVRFSNGHSVSQARMLAEQLSYGITQQDSVLLLAPGYALPSGSPFRNQRIAVKIMVPVGKEIFIGDDMRLNRWGNYWNNDWDDNWDRWDDNTLYRMTPEGLKKAEEIEIPEAPEQPEHPEAPEAPEHARKPARNVKYHEDHPAPPADEEGRAEQDATRSTRITMDGFSETFNALFALQD